MSSAPAIVLIPGAFAYANLYDDFVTKLKSSGFSTIEVVPLPTVDDVATGKPAPPMQADAAAVSSTVSKLADAGHEILLLPHSYGGVPTTEIIHGLTKAQRSSAGKSGGIIGVLYVTCIVPAVGKTLASIMPKEFIDNMPVENGWMVLPTEAIAPTCFSDLPAEEGLLWAKKFGHHSLESYHGELSNPGYNEVPVSWMFTEADAVVTPEMQKGMIEQVEKSRGGKIDVYSYNVGHAPHISKPETVLDAIRKTLAALK